MSSSVKKRHNKFKRFLSAIIAATLTAPLLLVAGVTPASAVESSYIPELRLKGRGLPISSASCTSHVTYRVHHPGPKNTTFTYNISGLGSYSPTLTEDFGSTGLSTIEWNTSNLPKGTYKPVLRVNNEVVTFKGNSTPLSLTVGDSNLVLSTSITKAWSDADPTLTMSVSRHKFSTPDSGDNYTAWPLKVIVEEQDGTKLGELNYLKGEQTKTLNISKHTVENRKIRLRAVDSCASGTVEATVPGFIKRQPVTLSFAQSGGAVYGADSGPYGTVTLSNPKATGSIKVPSQHGWEPELEFPIVDGKAQITKINSNAIAPLAGSYYFNAKYSGDTYYLPTTEEFVLKTAKSTAGIELIDGQYFLFVEPDATGFVEFKLKTPYGRSPGYGALSGLKVEGVDGKPLPVFGYNSADDVYTLSSRGPIYTEDQAARIAESEGSIQYRVKVTYNGDTNHDVAGAQSAEFMVFPFVRDKSTVQPETMFDLTAGVKNTVRGTVSMSYGTYSEYFLKGKVSHKILDSTGKEVFSSESDVSANGRYSAEISAPESGAHTLVTQYLGKSWMQDSPKVSQPFNVAKHSVYISEWPGLSASYDSDSTGTIALYGRDNVPMADQSVSYTLNFTDRDPVTTTVVTDQEGKFEFAIPHWPSFTTPGTITVEYPGNPTYRAETATFTIKANHFKRWEILSEGPTQVPFEEEATVEFEIPAAKGSSGETASFSLFNFTTNTSTEIGSAEIVDGKVSVTHPIPFGSYAIAVSYAKPDQEAQTVFRHDVQGIRLTPTFDVQSEIQTSRNGEVTLSGHVRSPRAGLIPQGTVELRRANNEGTVEVELDEDGAFSLQVKPTRFTATHDVHLNYYGDSTHFNVYHHPITLLEDPSKDPIELDVEVVTTDLSHGVVAGYSGTITSPYPTSIPGTVSAYLLQNGVKRYAGQSQVDASGRFNVNVLPLYGTTELIFEYKSRTFGEDAAFSTLVTVKKSQATLTVTGSEDLSLFSGTTLDLTASGPGTTALFHDFTYTYAGNADSSKNLRLPESGVVRLSGWYGKLTVPAIRPPLATPESVTFTFDESGGFIYEPVTFVFSDATSDALTLDAPETALAREDIDLKATVDSGHEGDDVSGTFEFFTTDSGVEKTIGSVASSTGSAVLRTTLPSGSNTVGVRFVQNNEALAQHTRSTPVDIKLNSTEFVGAATHALNGEAPSTYVGRVSSISAVTFGTVAYEYESVLGRHSGSTIVDATGAFSIALPTWNLAMGADLALSYVKNDVFDASSSSVSLVPDSRVMDSTVTLSGSNTALEGIAGVFKATVVDKNGLAVSGGTVHLQRVLGDGSIQHLMSTSVKNGQGSFSYTPKSGTYTLRTEFSGHGLIAANASNSIKFAVTGLTSVSAKVSGDARVGQAITASSSTNIPASVVKYQWYVNGKKISGATGKSYTVPTKYVGKKFTVKATATRAGKTVSATSKSTISVKRAVTTLKVTPSKSSITRGHTATIKVKVSAPGVTAIKGKIWLKVGDHKVSKTVTKSGTYTFKVKTSGFKKGSTSVKAAFSATSATKKYAVSPKADYAKVTLK